MAGAQETHAATLDWLTGRVLEAVARDERVVVLALQLLPRRFSATASFERGGAIGAALGHELDGQALHGCGDRRGEWLVLFGEVAAISDDLRLPRAVDASLACMNVSEVRGLAVDAVDVLERIVAGAYRPSEGVSREIGGTPFVRGDLKRSCAVGVGVANGLSDNGPPAVRDAR